jgi:hypothetical protein
MVFVLSFLILGVSFAFLLANEYLLARPKRYQKRSAHLSGFQMPDKSRVALSQQGFCFVVGIFCH